jgi:lipopolysaccharide export LptBFGC system permease protein LptF
MTTEHIKKAETIALMLYMVSIGYYAGSHGVAWSVLVLGAVLYLAVVLALEHLKKAALKDSLPKPQI